MVLEMKMRYQCSAMIRHGHALGWTLGDSVKIKNALSRVVQDSTSVLLLGVGGLLLFSLAGVVLWHFQLGADIPWLEIKNKSSAQYWGQIGDFFGGVLNPLLSFLALIAVSLSLRSQTAELKAAREEAAASQQIQNVQTKVYERQSFESVFFGLLQLHSNNLESMRRNKDGASGRSFFSQAAYSFYPNLTGEANEAQDLASDVAAVRKAAEQCFEFNGVLMAHYFQTLLELLDYVDSYGEPKLRRASALEEFFSNPSPETVTRRRYARIVRSVLSWSELHLIFLYCVTSDGARLRKMVEEYSLLKEYDVDGKISVEVKTQFLSFKAFGLIPEILDLKK
jgi:hypothetical protein